MPPVSRPALVMALQVLAPRGDERVVEDDGHENQNPVEGDPQFCGLLLSARALLTNVRAGHGHFVRSVARIRLSLLLVRLIYLMYIVGRELLLAVNPWHSVLPLILN